MQFDNESLIRVINKGDSQDLELNFDYLESPVQKQEDEENYDDYVNSYLYDPEILEETQSELKNLKQSDNRSLLQSLTNPLQNSLDYTKQLAKSAISQTISTTNTVSQTL